MALRDAHPIEVDQVETIIGGLSSYIVSRLRSLGYQKHGVAEEDLLQEIHIRIWKAIKKNNGNIKYFNAYLNKIIYSVFINEITKIKKDNMLITAQTHIYSISNSIRTSSDVNMSVKKNLVAAIDSLQDSKRVVVKLRLEGFSFKEIAILNRWSYRKTYCIFYRALEELKRKLCIKGIIYED